MHIVNNLKFLIIMLSYKTLLVKTAKKHRLAFRIRIFIYIFELMIIVLVSESHGVA